MSDTRSERTERIADAALAVLGRAGARRLTHRAVDAEAGLPEGSTSYYCRRRVDLLALAERRLLELDRADVARLAERLSAGRPSLDAIAEGAAGLIVRWLTPPTRARTMARYELYLEAAREPAMRATMAEHLLVFGELAGRVGATAAARPGRAMPILLLAEGITVTALRTGTTPRRRDVARMLRQGMGGR